MFGLRTPTIGLLVHLLTGVLLLTGGALPPVFSATPNGNDNPTTAANEGFMPDSVLNNSPAKANVVVVKEDLRQDQDVVSADHQQKNKVHEQLSPFAGNGTAAVNDNGSSTAEVLAEEEVDGQLLSTTTDQQTRETPAAAVRVKHGDDAPAPTNAGKDDKDDCGVSSMLMRFLGGFVGFGFSLGTGLLIASVCMICCRPKGDSGVQQQMSESQISLQQSPAESGSQESQPVPLPKN